MQSGGSGVLYLGTHKGGTAVSHSVFAGTRSRCELVVCVCVCGGCLSAGWLGGGAVVVVVEDGAGEAGVKDLEK